MVADFIERYRQLIGRKMKTTSGDRPLGEMDGLLFRRVDIEPKNLSRAWWPVDFHGGVDTNAPR